MSARPPDPPIPPRGRLTATAEGTHHDAFAPAEWGLLASVAALWGSSFMFIDLALNTFAPPVVALGRLALGATTLSLVPRARRPVDRADLPRVALLGVVWMAVPLLLFPIAQQHVDSSVAGMINGAAPLFTGVVAAVMLRRLPGRRQLAGLAIGFLGVVAISAPNLGGASASAYGVGLLLVAVTLYGVAFNLAVPLQQRYGSLPVLLRAQAIAAALVLPAGLAGIPASTWSWISAGAVLALGVLCTGVAFAAFTTLVGRVGGPRGSVATYVVPVVAVVLGVVVLDEHVTLLALVGMALVLVGAWLASRADTARPRPHPAGQAETSARTRQKG